MASDREQLDALPLPDTSLRGLARSFGPGVILMMTGIGTSHLVTAPVAGGRFEFALLWCIPVAYLFKYHGFEMAFRFTNATGRSMLDAYSTAPGKWPLWYVLVTTLVQCALGQAGRLVAAAAVLYFVFSEQMGLPVSIPVYGLVLGVTAVALLLVGRYGVMEQVTKVLAGILFLSTVGVYRGRPGALRRARPLRAGRGAGRLVADHRRLPRPAADGHRTCRSRPRSGARPRRWAWGASASSSSAWGSLRPSTRCAQSARICGWTPPPCRRTRGSTAGAGSESASSTSGSATWCRSSSRRCSCCWPPYGSIPAPSKGTP